MLVLGRQSQAVLLGVAKAHHHPGQPSADTWFSPWVRVGGSPPGIHRWGCRYCHRYRYTGCAHSHEMSLMLRLRKRTLLEKKDFPKLQPKTAEVLC